MNYVYNVWVIDRNNKCWWLTQTEKDDDAEKRRKAFEKFTDKSRYFMTLVTFCRVENRNWVFDQPVWPIDYED